jgi:hypothetical protein
VASLVVMPDPAAEPTAVKFTAVKSTAVESTASVAPDWLISLLIGIARTMTAGFVVLAAGLAAQLWRHGALLGGQLAKAQIPHDSWGWRLPHFVANGVSLVGGTLVAPVLLFVLAAVVAAWARRWWPLLGAGAAVFVLYGCLAVGKGLGGTHAMSGPATATVVCWGVAGWLLRDQFGTPVLGRLRRALHWLAASAALVIGVAQLYLGHPLLALLASWLVGGLILGVFAMIGHRHTARSDTVRGV